MSRYRLAPLAQKDIQAILAWTHEQFGERQRERYEALIVQAIIDVAADPQRAGAQARPELAKGAITYHLLYSRDRVARSQGHVRKPRHFLLFRESVHGSVEIARVLHDSMDLTQHLPEEFPDPDG